MLIEVWDADGEMFEVRPDEARRLVVEFGWSPTKEPLRLPSDEPEAAPAHEDAPDDAAHDDAGNVGHLSAADPE